MLSPNYMFDLVEFFFQKIHVVQPKVPKNILQSPIRVKLVFQTKNKKNKVEPFWRDFEKKSINSSPGGSKEICNLVTKAGIVSVFHDSHQLNTVIS